VMGVLGVSDPVLDREIQRVNRLMKKRIRKGAYDTAVHNMNWINGSTVDDEEDWLDGNPSRKENRVFITSNGFHHDSIEGWHFPDLRCAEISAKNLGMRTEQTEGVLDAWEPHQTRVHDELDNVKINAQDVTKIDRLILEAPNGVSSEHLKDLAERRAAARKELLTAAMRIPFVSGEAAVADVTDRAVVTLPRRQDVGPTTMYVPGGAWADMFRTVLLTAARFDNAYRCHRETISVAEDHNPYRITPRDLSDNIMEFLTFREFAVAQIAFSGRYTNAPESSWDIFQGSTGFFRNRYVVREKMAANARKFKLSEEIFDSADPSWTHQCALTGQFSFQTAFFTYVQSWTPSNYPEDETVLFVVYPMTVVNTTGPFPNGEHSRWNIVDSTNVAVYIRIITNVGWRATRVKRTSEQMNALRLVLENNKETVRARWDIAQTFIIHAMNSDGTDFNSLHQNSVTTRELLQRTCNMVPLYITPQNISEHPMLRTGSCAHQSYLDKTRKGIRIFHHLEQPGNPSATAAAAL